MTIYKHYLMYCHVMSVSHCAVTRIRPSSLQCFTFNWIHYTQRPITHWEILSKGYPSFNWITLDKKNLLGFSIIEICWNIASQVVIFIVTNLCWSPDLTYLHLEILKSLKQSTAICYTNWIFCSVIFHNMNYRQSWRKKCWNI